MSIPSKQESVSVHDREGEGEEGTLALSLQTTDQ